MTDININKNNNAAEEDVSSDKAKHEKKVESESNLILRNDNEKDTPNKSQIISGDKKSGFSEEKFSNSNKQLVDEKTTQTKPPKKPLPIEKKPFQEFINDHLLPEITSEFIKIGKSINEIKLEKDTRPIAGDKCWYIFCSIKDTCNFWISFEEEDISSLKSFTLCKLNEKPSVLESFLIDEKKITLKLIISRILQRLNGQKLLGVN